MQTTLLGLGIAIILALVTALVGPYFVDWSAYRGLFEAHASRLVGAPVRIGGDIEVRALPVPSVTVREIELRPREGAARLRAQELSIAIALGPLLRGAWRASEVRIVGAEASLGLDPSGRLDWRSETGDLDPEALAIENLTVENARIALSDAASGAQTTLEQVRFNGDIRSFAGPARGEGRFVAGGRSYDFRVSAGRRGADGEVKLRVALDRAQEPLALEADGTLKFERGIPAFEGAVTVSQPAGIVLVEGRAAASEPWRMAGRIKASPAGVLAESLEISFGPEERALRLGGAGEVKFGGRPRCEAVLSARQLDLDRFAALPEGARRLPAGILRAAAEKLRTAPLPPLPVRLGIGVDALTMGGATVQAVRGDLRSDADGWEIETLEFRAPGFAQLRASGRLAVSPQGYSFEGPASLEATDPRALAAWLEGRAAATAGAVASPLKLRGDIAVTPERLAVSRLSAEFDRKTIAGRLAYRWSSPAQPQPRLEAEVNAAELDLDAVAALARATLPEASGPGEMALALEVGRVTLAGVQATGAKARLKLDGEGLAVERLAIGDLAGAALSLTGRIEGPWTAPRGALTVEVAGERLDGLAAVLDRAAPRPAAWLRAQAAQLAPAKLHLTLKLDRPPASAQGGAGAAASLRLDGHAGPLRIALDAEARGEATAWEKAELRAEGRIDSEDGRVLAGIAGLDALATIGAGPGSLRWRAAGPLGGGLAVRGQVTAPGLDLAAAGNLDAGLGSMVRARAEVSADLADAAVLRQVLGRPAQPAPLALKAQLILEDDRVVLSGVSAKVAGSAVGGRLALTLGKPLRIDGRLEADQFDLAALVGALAGMPAAQAGTPAARGAGWSGEPFGARFLDDVAGRIEISAARGTLSPALEVRELRAALQLKSGEAALEDIEGRLGDGRVQAAVTLQSGPLGTAASGRISVIGADLAALWPGAARPPATGRVSLQIEAKGSGRSPSTLLGALGGTGTVSFEGLEIAGLSPAAFAAAIRAADERGAVAPDAIRAVVEDALGKGPLRVPRADGALTVTAGQARLGSVMARGEHADLAVSANVDLAKGLVEARYALLGPEEGGVPGRPEIDVLWRGPLSAPQRSVDVSALVGWLTLRAVDQQARRLQAAETERRRVEEAVRRAQEEAARRAAEEEAARRAAEAEARRHAPAGGSPAPSAPPASGPPERPTASPAAAGGDPVPPAARQAPGARRPAAPTVEPPPPLPPPIDIRPAPGSRRPNAQRASPPASAPPEREPTPRPPADLPAAAEPELFDSVFEPGRWSPR
ncbi:MAG: AsmA family protein [Variibacter sp.]|nr:AsmA family protein [Variibacter sp.]